MQDLKHNKHIVIFDGSLKTTAFINRLALALAKEHSVTILGFANQKIKKLPGVAYVVLGSKTQKIQLFYRSLFWAFRLCLQQKTTKPLAQICKAFFVKDARAIQQQNFNTVLQLIQPSLLHVQWPSLLPWCEDVLNQQKLPVVLSQRGYQTNVRALVNTKEKKYLESWYPKIAGFHSVSNAIETIGKSIQDTPNAVYRVVYSGFQIEKFPKISNWDTNKPLHILSVGRPHWIKDYKTAIEACALLKTKGIDFNYTIVGAQGNEELQYIIKNLGLQHHITLMPKIKQDKVYAMMKTVNLLLFPSLAEGLPNVVVEAMLLGLPVVSTNCGGIGELITPDTGWLVPIAEPKAMADAIVKFKQTSIPTLNTMRNAAYTKAKKQHNETKMITDMELLYCDVLQKHAK